MLPFNMAYLEADACHFERDACSGTLFTQRLPIIIHKSIVQKSEFFQESTKDS